ncbi:50S ribosomal protein L10 [Candidatus Parcubacteria bacterium]|jgi:large subunit ribosomal protein L10|nr:50S ribosomal protein L10 [Candidatus Parcubacteria bacterium]MBT7228129.1 50S ribosomal protein L10 [Candidatus Parcubacteria bacterium]
MAKSKEQKKEILAVIKDKMAKSKSVVFSSDTGLNVKTVEEMRKDLRENGAEYLVTKKTLLKKATKDFGDSEAVNDLSGSVAMVLSYEDEIAGAKIVNKYVKSNKETLAFGGGILENEFILADKVKQLALLPSREELLAKLVGSINSPLSGLVGVLNGVQRNFVGVLSAIKDQKS